MILMWHHPKYYQELAKIRKQFEKEQADKRASKRTSERASKQAIKRPGSEQASSVECGPNR